MTSIEKLAWALLTAAIVGLTGWVYSTGGRVAALEAQRASLTDDVKVIREDVRELRDKLLGPRK